MKSCFFSQFLGLNHARFHFHYHNLFETWREATFDLGLNDFELYDHVRFLDAIDFSLALLCSDSNEVPGLVCVLVV